MPTRSSDAVRCVEDDEPVVPLGRRDVPLVAQAEFEREPVANGDAILKEQADRALIDDAPPFAERDVERIGRAGEKRRHARKVEDARALGEVLVDEVPVLAAKLIECRPLARLNVSMNDIRRVVASLGSVPGPPKLRAPATIICGSPIERVTPSPMPNSAGLSSCAG